MIKKICEVVNPAGFHLRPAGLLCETAAGFSSSVHFMFRGNEYNAKSVLSVLGACVRCGDSIELIVDGPDENEAMAKVIDVILHDMTR